MLPPSWKAEFPILETGRVHVNHAGVAPIPGRARGAMIEYAQDASSRMGAAHAGWFARIEEIRAALARLLNADAGEIALIRHTTHGLQLVAASLDWKPGDGIVVEETTFPANWYVWKTLERLHGVTVHTWPERAFRYDPEDLEAILREKNVRLVSVSAADYGTGFRHDLEEIGRLVKEAGALYCVDAIQVLGAFSVDVEAARIDFLSADSHKWMLGPEGAGVFYVRRERLDEMNDLLCGWIGRQGFEDYEARDLPVAPTARRFEAGAQNIVGTLGMGGAVDLLLEVGTETISERVLENRRAAIEGMTALGWRCISPTGEKYANGTSTFRHQDVDEGLVVKRLLGKDIVASYRRGGVRISPHFYQPVSMIEKVVREVAEAMR